MATSQRLSCPAENNERPWIDDAALNPTSDPDAPHVDHSEQSHYTVYTLTFAIDINLSRMPSLGIFLVPAIEQYYVHILADQQPTAHKET